MTRLRIAFKIGGMPIGKDGHRIIAPKRVEQAVTEWINQILSEKKRNDSFGVVSVELTIKSGEVEMIRFVDQVTTKVEK